MPWLHELNWRGVTGGFIGRCTTEERDATIARALGAMGGRRTLVQAEQVHGGCVAIPAGEALDSGGPITLPGVDGLVSDAAEAALAIYVADCLAIYAADAQGSVAGVAHAGWRGLAARIPAALVLALGEAVDGAGDSLRAALGPCIRGCCFEVGEEVAEQFDGFDGAVDRSRAKPHVDMIAVATAQLEEAGVPRERIEVIDGCTRCDPDRFASYRWDPERCGRNVALIGLSR